MWGVYGFSWNHSWDTLYGEKIIFFIQSLKRSTIFQTFYRLNNFDEVLVSSFRCWRGVQRGPTTVQWCWTSKTIFSRPDNSTQAISRAAKRNFPALVNKLLTVTTDTLCLLSPQRQTVGANVANPVKVGE